MNRWRTCDRSYCDGSNGEVEFVPGKLVCCPQCGRELRLIRIGKTDRGRLPWHKKPKA